MKTAAITLIMVLEVTILAGCVNLPHAPSKADPRVVYAWPVAVCPSETTGPAGPHIAPVIAAIATTLLGDLVTGVTNAGASALSAAAAADKAGYNVQGINARNYFRTADKTVTEPRVSVVKELAPPGCYVVAYTQPVTHGKPWCNPDEAFAKSMKKSCANGGAVLKSLTVREEVYQGATPRSELNNTLDNLAPPEFYAEIALDQSGYSRVVRPRVAAMYYPQSLLQKGSDKPRMLSILLTPSTPAPLGADQFKSAAVALTFPSIAPSTEFSLDQLNSAMPSWSGVPDPQPFVDKLPKADLEKLFAELDKSGNGYVPVTIIGTVTEVGNPSVFLAAFADAFGKAGSDVSSKVLSNVNLAGGPSTTAAAQSKAEADYLAAVGAAQQARGALLLACSKSPSAPGDKANAQGLYTIAMSKQRAADLAAELAGKDKPFADPDHVSGADENCWQ